jgi:hypothetical protein
LAYGKADATGAARHDRNAGRVGGVHALVSSRAV